MHCQFNLSHKRIMLNVNGRRAVTDKPNRSLKIIPIEEAPIENGKPFGPCLLGPGNDSDWVTGYWNGEGWFGDCGLRLHPAFYALLPVLADLPA